MESHMTAYLCFPHPLSRFLHGRAWQSGSRRPLSLYLSQQTIQHDCMIPSDGSYVKYDAGVIDHDKQRELRIDGVVKTGGTMVQLNMPTEGEEQAVALTFEPSSAHINETALRFARRLFPEILSAMTAAGSPLDELLVVEGRLRLSARSGGLESKWSFSSSAPVEASVAELLSRKWEGSNVLLDGDNEDDGHNHKDGCSSSAVSTCDEHVDRSIRGNKRPAVEPSSASSNSSSAAVALSSSGSSSNSNSGGSGWISVKRFKDRQQQQQRASSSSQAAPQSAGSTGSMGATSRETDSSTLTGPTAGEHCLNVEDGSRR